MPLLISIIVPAYLEAEVICGTLKSLAEQAGPFEVVVVDGGSPDQTVILAESLVERIPYPLAVTTLSPGCRAKQLNHGAVRAKGDVLLFLHADTRLPPDGLTRIRAALESASAAGGHFDVAFDDSAWEFALIARAINLRTRLTRRFTGDMGIFVRRPVFEALGGYPDIPIMEDLAFSRRLSRCGRPVVIRVPVTTSARRWRQNGVWRTVLLMLALRLAYALGLPPARLALLYRHVR
jgi:rSAM/selenodomain-associated transferase 2